MFVHWAQRLWLLEVMGGVLQTNDEIPGYFISSAVDSAPDSYTIHPDPRIPYTDQHMRGNFKVGEN